MDRLEPRADDNFTSNRRLMSNQRGYPLITLVNGKFTSTN
jgi:hypothetical protein